VADFETAYNTFLGRSTLTKFMAIPHYTYLVRKMPGLCGVISIRGDVKRAYDYDKESCKTTDRLAASAELQQLKEAFAESPPSPKAIMLNSKTSKKSIQPEDILSKQIPLSTEEPSEVAHKSNALDLK
jgi:hypothetical protein